MKILFSTGSVFHLPIKDIFTLAAEAGFDGCDLVVNRAFNNNRYIDLLHECTALLPMPSVHAPFMEVSSLGNQVEALHKTVGIAKELGATVVNFHPPSWFSMEIKFFKWFRKVEDFQKNLGCNDEIFVTIENMPLTGKGVRLAPFYLNDVNDLIRFGMERNLYFTYDTTHLGSTGNDIIEGFVRYMGTKRLKNIHLSDYASYREHLFPGRGELPVVRLLNTIRRMNYEGMITVELSPYELPKATEWLRKVMSYMVSFIKLHTGVI